MLGVARGLSTHAPTLRFSRRKPRYRRVQGLLVYGGNTKANSKENGSAHIAVEAFPYPRPSSQMRRLSTHQTPTSSPGRRHGHRYQRLPLAVTPGPNPAISPSSRFQNAPVTNWWIRWYITLASRICWAAGICKETYPERTQPKATGGGPGLLRAHHRLVIDRGSSCKVITLVSEISAAEGESDNPTHTHALSACIPR